jgi:hypothetical protein
MGRRLQIGTLLFLAATLIGGCSRTKDSSGAVSTPSSSNEPSQMATAPASDQDAIVAAIQKHLRENSGINMAVMNMTVNGINIQGDQAQANAEFRLKQGGTSMQITYDLERHAGDWIVRSNKPAGGQFVHPPMDKTHSGTAGSAGQGSMPDLSDFLKNQNQH